MFQISVSTSVCVLFMILAGQLSAAETTQNTSTGSAGSTVSATASRPGAHTFKAALDLKGLSDDQKQKLSAIHKSYLEKTEAIRKQARPADKATSISKETMHRLTAEMKDLGANTQTEIEALLTEEQKKQFQESMSNVRARSGRKNAASETTGSVNP